MKLTAYPDVGAVKRFFVATALCRRVPSSSQGVNRDETRFSEPGRELALVAG